jgi:hypothetical protein
MKGRSLFVVSLVLVALGSSKNARGEAVSRPDHVVSARAAIPLSSPIPSPLPDPLAALYQSWLETQAGRKSDQDLWRDTRATLEKLKPVVKLDPDVSLDPRMARRRLADQRQSDRQAELNRAVAANACFSGGTLRFDDDHFYRVVMRREDDVAAFVTGRHVVSDPGILPGVRGEHDDPAPSGPVPLLGAPAPPPSPSYHTGRVLCQVLLSYDREATADTIYRSKKSDNPISSLLPAFVAAANLPQAVAGEVSIRSLVPQAPAEVAEAVHAIRGRKPLPAEPRELVYWAEIGEIDLPFARAAIHIKDSVTEAGFIGVEGARKAKKALLKYSDHLSAFEGRQCACAGQDLVDAYKRAIDNVIINPVCNEPGNARECHDQSEKDLLDEVTAALGRCGDEQCLEVALAADKDMHAVFDTEAKNDAEFDIANEPRRMISLGLLTGAVLGGKDADRRVKVNDVGVFAADTMAGQILTAPIVNVHPWRYTPSRPRMSLGERVRFILGVAATPSPGIVGGFGIELFRGLAVTGGITELRFPVPRQGEAIGDAPKDPGRPLRNAWGTAWFVGIGARFTN